MLKAEPACDSFFQVPLLSGQCSQAAGVGCTAHLSPMELGGWTALVATKSQRRRRSALLWPKVRLPAERGAPTVRGGTVFAANFLGHRCEQSKPNLQPPLLSVTLTLPFSEGRMMDAGEGKEELRIFPVSVFVRCSPPPPSALADPSFPWTTTPHLHPFWPPCLL